MNMSGDSIDAHLESALEAADDETARYHIREALQLRVVERDSPEGNASV